jgi:hypothetical protein
MLAKGLGRDFKALGSLSALFSKLADVFAATARFQEKVVKTFSIVLSYLN